MPSERVQRRIERLLEQADEAIDGLQWDRVRELAEAVLALDSESQDATTYLSAAQKALNLGSGSAPVADAESSTSKTSQESTPAQPTSFLNGRYVVKRFLGEGGKKKVYLCDDTVLDRDVAFATIKTAGLDEVGRQRIRREAQAMGRLGTHRHIVTVFELGELEDGQPYMVTELMEGGDVEALIEKAADRKLALERAIEIAVHVCRGLEFAHSKRLIHRDLKPGNVWLTIDGVSKIGDFGLVVAMDRSRITQAGMMVGTVSYMPPEQAMGGEPVFPSDLYSLGAMLYEMVTGRPPFVGDDNIGIISQHINTPPISPSWHRPDLPPALEGLILRLLEKDSGRRPATANEVLRALESINLTVRGELVEPPSADPSTGSGRTDVMTDSPIYRRSFVGRDAELKGLHTAFDNAMSGNGSLAMVVGEPGIGKTAVCEQLAAYVAIRGGRTLVGHCYEEGSLSLPYLAFVEAMRTYVLARPPEALKEELGSGATEVARIVSEVRDRVQIEPRPSGDPEDDRWRLLQAVTSFLRNAATTQPILLILEDLHWADRGTLDLLVHLARNMLGARLLVIGTYRDVEVDRAHPLSATLAELRRVGELHRVLLRGLTVDEVHRMIKIIGGQEISWAFAEAIHRQTEGNPLFIQEVLRYVVEEGMVTRQGGRWQQTGDTPLEMSIPEGLRDVIGRRLSRLGPEANRLLSIAAVIGRDFGLDTLRRISGLEEEPLMQALEEALKVGVLEEQSRPGVIRYRFAHAFFRQTLYEEMIAPRRLRLHQEVARALETQYAGRLEEHAAELAEHFSQSTDPNDLVRAVEYGELAARRAAAVYAYPEAARLLESAVQVQEVVNPNDKAKRCDLLLALGEALMPTGEPQRVYEEVAEEALALAEAIGDKERASRACQQASSAMRQYGAATMMRTSIFRRWAERSDRYALPGTLDRAHADRNLARDYQEAGQFGKSWELWVGALELAAHLGDPETFCAVASDMLNNGGSPQHYQDLLRVAEKAVEQSSQGISHRTRSLVLANASLVLLNSGDRSRAEELWQQAAEAAAHTQHAFILLLPLVNEILKLTLDGRLEEAVAASARLVSRAEELGAPVFGRQFAATRALRARLYLGNIQEALTLLPQARQMAGAEEGRLEALARALCLAHLNRAEEAQEITQQLRQSQTTGLGDETPGRDLSLLLETAVLLDDRQAVGPLALLLAPLASSSISGQTNLTCIARHLGAAAALLGEREKAKAYYQQALEVCAKVRFRPEAALTRLQLAELLLEEAEEIRRSQGRGDLSTSSRQRLAPTGDMPDVGVGSPDPKADAIHKEAIEHLDFAIAEFQEMKMQPSLERALRHKGLLKA